jgi:hypothetical protein
MRQIALVILLVVSGSLAASGQPISVGVVGGGSVVTPNLYSDESHRYIVGPAVDVLLPRGFAAEADVLYQRVGTDTRYGSILSGTNLVPVYPYADSSVARARGNVWQVPVIGKYYFKGGAKFRPFVGLGPEFRTVGWHTDSNSVIIPGPSATAITSLSYSESRSNSVGAVAVVGMRFQTGRLKFSPQFRFARWNRQEGSLRTNEAGLLLGIHF